MNVSLDAAQQAQDVQWAFNAGAALNNYLPETLRALERLQVRTLTPELKGALDNLRTIGTRRRADTDRERWLVQQRFLKNRVSEGQTALELDLNIPLKLR